MMLSIKHDDFIFCLYILTGVLLENRRALFTTSTIEISLNNSIVQTLVYMSMSPIQTHNYKAASPGVDGVTRCPGDPTGDIQAGEKCVNSPANITEEIASKVDLIKLSQGW